MKYAIIQTGPSFVSGKSNETRFSVIWGERAPGGYPVGFEGIDWGYSHVKNVTLEHARKILAMLEEDQALAELEFNAEIEFAKIKFIA